MIAVPTLHPAFLLRSGEGTEGQAKFTDTVISDFIKALNFLKRPPNWDEAVIWKRDRAGRFVNLYPTVADMYEFCRRAQGKLVSIDVETSGEQALACQLICIGMACENGDAICVPVLCQGGSAYWTQGDRDRAFGCLRWLFADRNTPKVMHNGAFDSVVLWANGLPVFESWTEDTIAAHHIADAELPHGLAYVASRLLELPYWKDDVKGDVRWLMLPDETLRSYNLRDCLATLRAFPLLMKDLEKWKLTDLYREEVELAYESAFMTLRGLRVDEPRRIELGNKLRATEADSIVHLRRIAGSEDFNPGSPVQLCEQLFEHLKFPIVKRTEKGNPSTDKDAMVMLSYIAKTEDQLTFLKHLVKWKKATKFLNTWVEGLPILGDGRLHPSWKLLTVTGRFASSPNAQNWNNWIKRMFTCEEENILVGMDLSQAELRVMAYFSGDPDLLFAYQHDLNVHTINTTLLFGLRNPGLDTSDATEEYLAREVPRLREGDHYMDLPVCPESRWKTVRTLAKNFVFGDNYGAEAKTLWEVIRAKRNPDTDELLFPDITLGQIEAAKISWEKLHPAIPGWWKSNVSAITKQGHYRCPVSGRIHWFRGGFQRNKMLNAPIQTCVASHMNKVMLRVARRLNGEIGNRWGLNAQVHDALTGEVPQQHAKLAMRIMHEEANKPFPLPGFPQAVLPADPPKADRYIDKV